MRISIKRKLLLNFVLFNLLFLVIFMSLSTLYKSFFIDLMKDKSVKLTEEILLGFTSSVYSRIENIHIFTDNPRVITHLKESNSKFGRLENRDSLIDAYDKKWILDNEQGIKNLPMQEIINSELSQNLDYTFVKSSLKRNGYAIIPEAFITNKYGVNVIQSGKTTDYKQSDEAWWNNAVSNGVSFGDISYDRSSSVYGIPVSKKITDSEGNFLGVIKIVISLFELIKEIDSHTQKYKSQEIILVSNEGKLIYHSKTYTFLADVTEEPFYKGVLSDEPFITDNGRLYTHVKSRNFYDNVNPNWLLVSSYDINEVLEPINSLQSKIYTLVGILFITGIIISIFVTNTISNPIVKLKEIVKRVAEGEQNVPIEINSKDEIGDLALEFKDMVMRREQAELEVVELNAHLEMRVKERTDELRSAQDKLVEAAHKAGMSDTASEILHNVGNVLSSVTTSTYMISKTMKNSAVNKIVNANKLLKKNLDTIESFIANDKRGKKLLHYYLEIEPKMLQEQESIEEHIARLQTKIDVIKDIIIAQQSYAKVDSMAQMIELKSVVDDALMITDNLIIQRDVHIITDYDETLSAYIHQGRLLHILINLIKNAIEAMDACDEKSITISIYTREEQPIIQISDIGTGIKGDISEVFTHGYTTKKTGHGFGLHSCLNSMEEMGGTIYAENNEDGVGCSFFLKFSATISEESRPERATS